MRISPFDLRRCGLLTIKKNREAAPKKIKLQDPKILKKIGTVEASLEGLSARDRAALVAVANAALASMGVPYVFTKAPPKTNKLPAGILIHPKDGMSEICVSMPPYKIGIYDGDFETLRDSGECALAEEEVLKLIGDVTEEEIKSVKPFPTAMHVFDKERCKARSMPMECVPEPLRDLRECSGMGDQMMKALLNIVKLCDLPTITDEALTSGITEEEVWFSGGIRTGTVVVPLKVPNSHNYPTNIPTIILFRDIGIRVDGTPGNHLPLSSEYASDSWRFATEKEIDELFKE